MEKLKYAVSTPHVKEKQNCIYWHKYLHLHLYKVKKVDNPVPPVQRIQLLSNTHFLWLPMSGSKLRIESSEYGAKKFQTALLVSEQRNQKHIQTSVSPLSVLRGPHSAAALCKLLWAALPVKATKGFRISVATGDKCVKCSWYRNGTRKGTQLLLRKEKRGIQSHQ